MRLILSNDQDRFYDLQASIHNLDFKQRFQSSAKQFFLFFGLAIVSVLIPVFHFFLVPLFLFLSLYIFIKAMKTKTRLDFSNPPACLNCQQPLSGSYYLTEEMRISCEKCSCQY